MFCQGVLVEGVEVCPTEGDRAPVICALELDKF
jgi:hypothetical protein